MKRVAFALFVAGVGACAQRCDAETPYTGRYLTTLDSDGGPKILDSTALTFTVERHGDGYELSFETFIGQTCRLLATRNKVGSLSTGGQCTVTTTESPGAIAFALLVDGGAGSVSQPITVELHGGRLDEHGLDLDLSFTLQGKTQQIHAHGTRE